MECSPEALAPYAGMDLATASCAALEDAGKADFWGTDDGSIDFDAMTDTGFWPAEEPAWQDMVARITAYQALAPQSSLDELDEALDWSEDAAVSVTFEQVIDDGLGGGPREMAVEISQGVIGVSLEDFLARVPAEAWGTNLAHYIGGEVVSLERDDLGRSTRQVERMVLSQLPLDLDVPCINADMTKLEEIVYGPDSVTVFWRVVYSDNGSTASDVGSVSFYRLGDDATLVTFHSAHLLRAAFGIPVPNWAAELALGPFFEDHIEQYRALVDAS